VGLSPKKDNLLYLCQHEMSFPNFSETTRPLPPLGHPILLECVAPALPIHSDKDKKKRHGPDDGQDEDGGCERDLGAVIRAKLLKAAVKRREAELNDLQEVYGEVCEGKRPLDPPKGHGYQAIRAWVHSQDQHSFCERLEKAIEKTERSLEALEERL